MIDLTPEKVYYVSYNRVSVLRAHDIVSSLQSIWGVL